MFDGKNIIAVFIRHYKDKDAKPLELYAKVNNNKDHELRSEWCNNESEAFVFNPENVLLWSVYARKIFGKEDIKYLNGVVKEEIAWKLTDKPETPHESNGYEKQYVKK